MTEYIIIVALIAVAAIGAFTYFGQTVPSQMSGIDQEVSGQNATNSIKNAKDAADNAKAETKGKGLANYDGNVGAGSAAPAN